MHEDSPRAEKNKQLLSHLFAEVLQRGNLAIIDRVFSVDFVDHSTPEQSAGPQGVKDYFTSLRTAFPDVQVTLDDLIAAGDKVVVRSTWRGTRPGSSTGLAAVDGPATRTLIQIFRIRDGKIVEEWNEGGELA